MHYGWSIVACVFIAQMFLTGFFTYAFSLFVVPVQNEFEASRTEVMYSMTLATIVGLLASPLIGSWVDRFSPRWLMTGGAILLAGGLLVLAEAHNVYVFAVVFGVALSIANLLLGPLTGSTVISRWFSANRGKALGVSAMGTSVGGIVIPMLVVMWLNDGDWRSAMRNLAYCVLVFVLPLVFLVMRPAPKTEAGQTGAGHALPQQELSFKDILKHRSYWAIGLSIGLLFSVYSAMLANLSPYAVNLGIDEAAAARLIMVISISGLVGKLIFGVVADKVDLRYGLWIAQLLVAAGFLVFALLPTYNAMLVASAFVGLAAGGMLPIWGALLATVFGVLSYGRVMGLMNPLITVLVMPSFTIAGLMYDATGGYSECFLLFAGVVVVAACILRLLRMPEPESAQAPA